MSCLVGRIDIKISFFHPGQPQLKPISWRSSKEVEEILLWIFFLYSTYHSSLTFFHLIFVHSFYFTFLDQTFLKCLSVLIFFVVSNISNFVQLLNILYWGFSLCPIFCLFVNPFLSRAISLYLTVIYACDNTFYLNFGYLETTQIGMFHM